MTIFTIKSPSSRFKNIRLQNQSGYLLKIRPYSARGVKFSPLYEQMHQIIKLIEILWWQKILHEKIIIENSKILHKYLEK